jgi:hypothetical protein
MNCPRKTLEDRIAEELKRQEDCKRALVDLRARAREFDRKYKLRRTIIRGLSAESRARNDPGFREQLDQAVLAFVTRPQDRELFPELFAAGTAREPSPSIAEAAQETASQPPHRPPINQKEPPPGRTPA